LRQGRWAMYLNLLSPSEPVEIGQVGDTQRRVFGGYRLKAIDASVTSTVIRGNTHAPVISIEERASDVIRTRVRKEHECSLRGSWRKRITPTPTTRGRRQ